MTTCLDVSRSGADVTDYLDLIDEVRSFEMTPETTSLVRMIEVLSVLGERYREDRGAVEGFHARARTYQFLQQEFGVETYGESVSATFYVRDSDWSIVSWTGFPSESRNAVQPVPVLPAREKHN